MTILNKISNYFTNSKSSGADSASLINLFGSFGADWSQHNYHTYANEGYIRNVIAHRCISLISSAIGSLVWKVHDADGKEITSGSIIDLLNRPNPNQGTSSFFTELETYKLISGNAYIHKITQGNKVPKELYNLRPDQISITAGQFKLPKNYIFTNNRNVTIPVNQANGESDILHIKFTNPVNDWYGLSPLASAMDGVDVFNEGNTWNKKSLQNSFKPSGMLVAKNKLKPTQVDQIKEGLEKYEGSSNAGKTFIADGDLQYIEIGKSSKDLDFLKGKINASRDIANAFGVPPSLIGLPEASTFNNVKEAKLELYEQIVLPEADVIVTELNHWLLPLFGKGYKLSYDLDQISALSQRRTEKWDRINNANFLSDSEKRELLGFEQEDNK